MSQHSTRTGMPIPASSLPISDEEFLRLATKPEKDLLIESFVLSQYQPRNLNVPPRWFRQVVGEIVCGHDSFASFQYHLRSYLTNGSGHIATLVCSSGDQSCAVVPAVGIVGEAPRGDYYRALAATRFWREAYESLLFCPNCGSAKLGRTRVISVRNRVAKLRVLCQKRGCTSRVLTLKMFFFYQDPLRQEQPPSVDEIITSHNLLKRMGKNPLEGIA